MLLSVIVAFFRGGGGGLRLYLCQVCLYPKPFMQIPITKWYKIVKSQMGMQMESSVCRRTMDMMGFYILSRILAMHQNDFSTSKNWYIFKQRVFSFYEQYCT